MATVTRMTTDSVNEYVLDQKHPVLETMGFCTMSVHGIIEALHGARNPMNSWNKSDTIRDTLITLDDDNGEYIIGYEDVIGENDMKLAQTLIKAGKEHCKFLRMVQVWVDINMPRYWWSEADTYHFGTKNSCSTMHKLLNNKSQITKDMFITNEEDDDWWNVTVTKLEQMRQEYLKSKDSDEKNRLLVRAKRILPEGFLQMRTWNTNYAELRNIYFQRKNHRLKEEWSDMFCEWIKTLPYAEELIMYEG